MGKLPHRINQAHRGRPEQLLRLTPIPITIRWLAGGSRGPQHPHALAISFPAPVAMSGLVLMPRQNHREHEGDTGVDVVLLVSGNAPGVRVEQHRNVIEAARRAGVKHVVYTSGLHADTAPPELSAEHLATEADLKASAVACMRLLGATSASNRPLTTSICLDTEKSTPPSSPAYSGSVSSIPPSRPRLPRLS